MLSLLPAIATLLLGATTASTPATSTAPVQSLTGTYRVLAADVTRPGESGTTDVYRRVLESGGRWLPVSVPDRLADGLSEGDRVRVTGRMAHGTLAVSSARSVAAQDAPMPATGTTRVLVVLAYWTSPDAVTPALARQVVLAQGEQWYAAASYGALHLTGRVTPWLRIAGPDGDCLDHADRTMAQAESAARAAGYDPAAYDRVVLYQPACGNRAVAGWAYAPGNRVWVNGALSPRVVLHEQGHNYGLGHAHSTTCLSGGRIVALSGTCAMSEYGDPYDAMGGSRLLGQYSSAHKDELGWFGAGQVRTLGRTDAAVLTPLESGGGVKAAVLRASAHRSYWFELRSRIGSDAAFPAGGIGVQVHLLDPALADGDVDDGGPRLLDLQPGGGPDPWASVVLAAGTSWTTPEGVLVRVGAVTGSSAQLFTGGRAVATPAGSPAPVSGLVVAGSQGSATVRWTPRTPPTPVRLRLSSTAGTLVRVAPAGATALLVSGLRPGASYAVTAVPVAAGQEGAPARATLAGSALTLTPPTAQVAVGGRLVLHGGLSSTPAGRPLAAARLVLSVRPVGTAAWRDLARLTTSASGAVAVPVTARASAQYRLRFDGSNGVTGRFSPAATVTVRTRRS